MSSWQAKAASKQASKQATHYIYARQNEEDKEKKIEERELVPGDTSRETKCCQCSTPKSKPQK
jgi:hypothetical protein